MNRHQVLRSNETTPIAILWFAVLLLTLMGYLAVPITRSSNPPLAKNINQVQPVGALLQNGVVQIDEAFGLWVSEPGVTERHYGKAGDWLAVGSSLMTEANGRARLHFVDGTVVRLGANAQMVLTASSGSGFVNQIQLIVGELWAVLGGSGRLEIKSPVGVAAVRGSYIHVDFNSGNQTYSVECFEGQCTLTTTAGTTNLTNGEKSFTSGGNQPSPPIKMTRAELVAFINNLPEAQTILATVAPLLTNAAPGGTVPGGGATITGNNQAGTLNVGTANIIFGAGVCIVHCSAVPALDPLALNNPPPGGGTLLSGLNLQVTNLPGSLEVPLINISFQPPTGSIRVGDMGEVTNMVIMQFDTSLVPPRWVTLPTFIDRPTQRLYTRARLFGKNFALFRQ